MRGKLVCNEGSKIENFVYKYFLCECKGAYASPATIFAIRAKEILECNVIWSDVLVR
jgi:hypothetical protein